MWTKKLACAWVSAFALTIVVVVVYCVMQALVDITVEEASEICSKDFPTYDYFKDPPTQSLEVWVYNMTNPGAFLTGTEGAEMFEFGPYVYDLDVKREHIDFYNGGSLVDFTLVNGVDFNQGESCVGCGDVFVDKVSVINPVYQAMLAGANSEFMLLLASTCSQQQIRNMLQNPTAPYCKKTDLNPNVGANCKCCLPAATTANLTALDPDGSLAYCADVTSPTGPKGSTVSWLASYDGGYKLSNTVTQTSFPLSTGVYTPLVRTYTINEMISGSVSALAGLFNYGAFSQSSDPEDQAIVQNILNTTKDVKEVCYSTSYDFCPQLSEVMAAIQSLPSPEEKTAYMRSIQCTGYIPKYLDLIDHGFAEERALELRYLEGVSCAQFAVSIAFAALLNSNPANSGTCVGGDQAPCCLDAFTLVGATGSQVGSGMGCLRFVDGLMQKRRVFSADEAERYLGSTVTHKTDCASSGRLKLQEWMGDTSLTEWFTPQGYTYPNMPWADPSIVRGAGTPQVPGSFTRFNLSDGRVVTQMLGAGPGKSFLRKNLNSGDVEEEEFSIFLPGINRIRTAKFNKNEYFEGLRVSKFYLKRDVNTASAESQQQGLLPYPNMVNMLYTSGGLPVTLSMPNFMGVDSDIYTQSSNAKRGYPDGVGVTLYRTHKKYNAYSAEIEPEQITADTAVTYQEDFANWWEFEPATGLTITNQAAAMFSMFTMNCNPALDPTCSFAREEDTNLCYPGSLSDGTAVSSPCSNANVFTPRVQGEKVLPMYWNRVTAAPPDDAISTAVNLLNVRYAFSILCIIVPAIFALLIAYTMMLWKRDRDPIIGAGRDSVVGMTDRKSRVVEVSLENVEKNPIQLDA